MQSLQQVERSRHCIQSTAADVAIIHRKLTQLLTLAAYIPDCIVSDILAFIKLEHSHPRGQHSQHYPVGDLVAAVEVDTCEASISLELVDDDLTIAPAQVALLQ